MIKNLIIFALCLLFAGSCIKKKAIKYDPEMVGTWVGNADGKNYWFIVNENDDGEFRTYKDVTDDRVISGKVKYSVFELKMWVGTTKFKVKEWLTSGMYGLDSIATKDYATLRDTTYSVDRRMVLRLPFNNDRTLLTLGRIRQ